MAGRERVPSRVVALLRTTVAGAGRAGIASLWIVETELRMVVTELRIGATVVAIGRVAFIAGGAGCGAVLTTAAAGALLGRSRVTLEELRECASLAGCRLAWAPPRSDSPDDGPPRCGRAESSDAAEAMIAHASAAKPTWRAPLRIDVLTKGCFMGLWGSAASSAMRAGEQAA